MYDPDLAPSGFTNITPSDTAGVAFVTVVDSNGVTSTFTACPQGFVIVGRILMVKATGTR